MFNPPKTIFWFSASAEIAWVLAFARMTPVWGNLWDTITIGLLIPMLNHNIFQFFIAP